LRWFLKQTSYLCELTARRPQLQALLHAETCCRDVGDSAVVRKSLRTIAATIERSLAVIGRAISERIASSAYAETNRRLQLCGVGPAIAETLIADLPELGQANCRAFAALPHIAAIAASNGDAQPLAMVVPGVPNAL
jgi:transposase